jgi:hypothetical protein
MGSKLYYNTVSPLLLRILKTLMSATEFDSFRLVGGTALSLLRGHRELLDIDLFTDSDYDSVDFDLIDSFLRKSCTYVDTYDYPVIGMGKSYFVGKNKDNSIKLDLYYTEKFIQVIQLIDDIRFATIEEIIAMKINVISKGGRKKDFWDIHELKDDYSLDNMLALHGGRYPYDPDPKKIKKSLTDFKIADDDFDPICLKGKHWEIIKLDLIDFVKRS